MVVPPASSPRRQRELSKHDFTPFSPICVSFCVRRGQGERGDHVLPGMSAACHVSWICTMTL